MDGQIVDVVGCVSGPVVGSGLVSSRVGRRAGKLRSLNAGGTFFLLGWLVVAALFRTAIISARLGQVFEFAW